ncbi:hypothetical protein C4H11_07515 [Bacteroides zoogleoformans]|uniref:Uncharacterized protein n=1 Tax=Bacteroides zoogleoformans TaxID=28119 RepID=A0ABN5IJ09_9BACE|nr:hypothetical protein C4H11_07515 [Bacteroides zoogleoformans]
MFGDCLFNDMADFQLQAKIRNLFDKREFMSDFYHEAPLTGAFQGRRGTYAGHKPLTNLSEKPFRAEGMTGLAAAEFPFGYGAASSPRPRTRRSP